MPSCFLCPRRCGKTRTAEDPGYCGSAEPTDFFRVARLMVHHGEEPCISGIRGSGTIFFSGCSLRCCFCQNYEISLLGKGRIMDQGQLAEAMLQLASLGVHNLSLVTPSHYADRIPKLFSCLSSHPQWQKQPLPVIWNSSGYETADSLQSLAGLVDIFMPDLKYLDPDVAAAACKAPDYFQVASMAILAMHKLQPDIVFDPSGLLRKGMLVRHLVLPGHWQDSCRILDFLAENLPPDIPISLMSQFTPQPHLPLPDACPELARHLTTLEYQKVAAYALEKGFTRLIGQDRSAAGPAYTPDFSAF
jgi:putative pyruvate formate lyase activating enzyme